MGREIDGAGSAAGLEDGRCGMAAGLEVGRRLGKRAHWSTCGERKRGQNGKPPPKKKEKSECEKDAKENNIKKGKERTGAAPEVGWQG